MNKYVVLYRPRFYLTILLNAISQIMFVFIAIILQHLIEAAINKDLKSFTHIAIFSIVYFAIMAVFNYVAGLVQSSYIRSTLIALRRDIFRGIITRDYRRFNSVNTGDYLSNLTNDINLIENNYLVPVIQICTEISGFAVTLIVLMYINIWVTLLLLVSGVVMFIVPQLFSKKLEDRNNKVSLNLSYFTKRAKDILEGYEVIKSYSVAKDVSYEFDKYNKDLEGVKYNKSVLNALISSISLLVFIICQLSGIIAAAYLVLIGQLSVGSLMAVFQLGNGVFAPIRNIIQYLTTIRGMKGVNAKVADIAKDGFVGKSKRGIPSFDRDIALSNVSFSYNEDKLAIKDFTYTFKKNNKYALVGESGCGKTTLVKLIMGYYEDYSGHITIDGVELRDIDETSLAGLISVVHQNVYMFDKTIQENILLYHEYPQEVVGRALDTSGVSRFVSSMNDGIYTCVGENGSNLSGGQKQRVAVARALVKGTPILILDEGTSALDSQTAYDIENALLNIEDLTLITVTHKLDEEILERYDDILVMDSGELIEHGSFEDLTNKEGGLYRLYNIHREEAL